MRLKGLTFQKFTFQLISNMFSVVEVRAFSRLLKFFHTNSEKPYLYGPPFVYSLDPLVPVKGNHTTAYKGILDNFVPAIFCQQ